MLATSWAEVKTAVIGDHPPWSVCSARKDGPLGAASKHPPVAAGPAGAPCGAVEQPFCEVTRVWKFSARGGPCLKGAVRVAGGHRGDRRPSTWLPDRR